MSAVAAALVRSFRVGRYTCTLTVPPIKPGSVLNMVVEWHPDMPARLSKREWRQYLAGRDAAFAELVERTGVSAVVVDA